MKEKRILDALNDIDERYIEDAAPGRRHMPKKPLYKRLITVAAMLVLITGAVFWMRGRFGRSGEGAMTEATPTLTEAQMIPQTTAPLMTEAAPEGRTEAPTEGEPQARPETKAGSTEATMSPESCMEQDGPMEETVKDASDFTVYPGDAAWDLLIWYGIPEKCTKLEVSATGSGKARTITDPEAIEQIYELLKVCKCVEAAEVAEDETAASPLAIQACFEDGSWTGLYLYSGHFSCGGHYFEVSPERLALLLPYLEP